MHLSGLSSNDQALISNSQIDEALESLIRSAALNTVREIKSGLSGLDTADNERDFDAMLENNVMNKTLEGLASGDLIPLTANQFEKEIYSEFNSGEMAGFFSSITKFIKKTVTAPLQILKKVVKVVKKVAKKITPVFKKIIPIAAGAAALYFTGGAAAPFLGKIMGAAGSVGSAVLGSSGAPPQPEQQIEYVQETIQQAAQNPQMINAGVQVTQAMLRQRGIAMNSPQAKSVMRRAVQGQYIKLNRKIQPVLRVAQSRKTGIPLNQLVPPQEKNKMIVPLLAAGGAALFMFMK